MIDVRIEKAKAGFVMVISNNMVPEQEMRYYLKKANLNQIISEASRELEDAK